MSSVRMCDVCGNLFSEREKGWRTMLSQIVSDDVTKGPDKMDACPTCAGSAGKPPVPKLAISSGKSDDTIVAES